jgi:hypothetical protein
MDSVCVIEQRSFIQATNPSRPPSGKVSAALARDTIVLGTYSGVHIEGCDESLELEYRIFIMMD